MLLNLKQYLLPDPPVPHSKHSEMLLDTGLKGYSQAVTSFFLNVWLYLVSKG